jgi:hypothetical protein
LDSINNICVNIQFSNNTNNNNPNNPNNPNNTNNITNIDCGIHGKITIDGLSCECDENWTTNYQDIFNIIYCDEKLNNQSISNSTQDMTLIFEIVGVSVFVVLCIIIFIIFVIIIIIIIIIRCRKRKMVNQKYKKYLKNYNFKKKNIFKKLFDQVFLIENVPNYLVKNDEDLKSDDDFIFKKSNNKNDFNLFDIENDEIVLENEEEIVLEKNI